MRAAVWPRSGGPGETSFELGFLLPERKEQLLTRVRTYVRFQSTEGPFPPFPGAPDRLGRSGPSHHAGGRTTPAGAGTVGSPLPRWGAATGDDDHGGRT